MMVRNGVRNENLNGTTAHEREPGRLQFEPLDKTSFTPLYFQIQSHLLKMIQSGQLRAGDPVPSEEELARVYGVSRMTTRQALQSLKSQGYADGQKGRGTFVTQPKVEKDIAHLAGFTAEMRSLGMKASSRVLESSSLTADDETASRLQIEPGARIFRLVRLRYADHVPVAIEEGSLSLERFPGIDKVNFITASLYQTLRDRYRVAIDNADEILEARAANRNEAELLDIRVRSSLLVISRILRSADGKPIEAARSLYRGDRYRAVLKVYASVTE
ncbi:MAG TPA: GntR family transcriptional regulator [Edaphobacter sp.]|jgi:GntR family transcriptional regulator|nr:GntR family transcriptional regulator [Edaphobacter sp.]